MNELINPIKMPEKEYVYDYQERKEMLRFVPDSCRKILEVGCGDGSFAAQLKKREGTEVWGIELHPEPARIASGRIDHVLTGDFENLVESQLPKAYFDCIVFNDALEHFPFPDKVLLKIRKLLSPGGYVVSSLPNFRHVGNLWEVIIEKDFRYKPSGILDYTHYRFFTMKSIRRMFGECGYNLILCQGINPTKSIKVKVFNWLSFNFFSDVFYLQIASVAQLK